MKVDVFIESYNHLTSKVSGVLADWDTIAEDLKDFFREDLIENLVTRSSLDERYNSQVESADAQLLEMQRGIYDKMAINIGHWLPLPRIHKP